MDRETTKGIINPLLTIMLLVAGIFIGTLIDEYHTNQDRLDRVENLLNRSEYGYMTYVIATDNSTIGELKTAYYNLEDMPSSRSSKLLALLGIEYICDGGALPLD